MIVTLFDSDVKVRYSVSDTLFILILAPDSIYADDRAVLGTPRISLIGSIDTRWGMD